MFPTARAILRLLLGAWVMTCLAGVILILLPESRQPLVGADGWPVTAGFFANGEPQPGDLPASVRTAPGAKFWRSWSPETNATPGRLESATFTTAAPAVSVLVVGYPAGPNNYLYLENTRTGERFSLRYGNAHETWQECVVKLPPSWRGAPLKVGANAGSRTWVGLGTPFAVGWSTLLKRSLPAAVAWHALAMLALFGFSALVARALGRLDPRRGPGSRWLMLPLALALLGKAAFFAYQVSPTWTLRLALVLTLAGLFASRAALLAGLKSPLRALGRRPVVAVWILVTLGSWLALNAQQTVSVAYAANYRFTPASWSTDNQIPVSVAELLHRGAPLRTPGAIWQVSDRPHAFTGVIALARSATDGLFAAPNGSQLFVWLATLVGIVVMSTWIFPAWEMLRRAGLRGQLRLAATLALAVTPFIFFNSLYIWPKMLSASLALLGWLMLDPSRPAPFAAGASVVAGLAFGLALLCHGGIFFTHLPMGLWLAATQLRRHWGSIALCALVFGLVLLPWLVWVQKVDPPGNALTKYAFAGTFGFNERDLSLGETVARAYRDDTRAEWLKRKTLAIKTWFGAHETVKGSHMGWPDEGLQLRDAQYFHLVWALGPLLLLAVGLRRRHRTPLLRKPAFAGHYSPGAWLALGVASLVIQLALFWVPFSLHETSYGAVLLLHLALLVLATRVSGTVRFLAFSLVFLNFIVGWLIEPAAYFGYTRPMTFVVALALAVTAAVVALRGLIGAGTSLPEPAKPLTHVQ